MKRLVNWKAAASQPAAPMVVEPGTAESAEPSVADAGGNWLCAWCLNRVANEKDRFCYQGQDEFTFTNPDGIRSSRECG